MSRSTVALVGAAVFAGCAGGCGNTSSDGNAKTNAPLPRAAVEASFPKTQLLAKDAWLVISVRNTGSAPLDHVTLSVDGFNRRSSQPGLANPSRPEWIVSEEPPTKNAAFNDTWSAGPLQPGKRAVFRWKLTPVRAGAHQVSWIVSTGPGDGPSQRLASGDLSATVAG
jgi:hypothetical protein